MKSFIQLVRGPFGSITLDFVQVSNFSPETVTWSCLLLLIIPLYLTLSISSQKYNSNFFHLNDFNFTKLFVYINLRVKCINKLLAFASFWLAIDIEDEYHSNSTLQRFIPPNDHSSKAIMNSIWAYNEFYVQIIWKIHDEKCGNDSYLQAVT